ncbi:unnamed protein product [Linum trigynum]|uniref:Uncharacterized protein n=1 Tax=Linum trigynum TaxID=586398 RepID=A0AAV2DVI3_9ROSI
MEIINNPLFSVVNQEVLETKFFPLTGVGQGPLGGVSGGPPALVERSLRTGSARQHRTVKKRGETCSFLDGGGDGLELCGEGGFQSVAAWSWRRRMELRQSREVVGGLELEEMQSCRGGLVMEEKEVSGG